ncbi:MAG TPA: hypothetical protein VK212_06990 [Lentimicrobium sp.]|nr:hypothetical protein [Lentimicrobium sp.]
MSMLLEKEITEILKEKPDGMTVHQIARRLIQKGLMNENDSKICYFQVHARTHNMPELFEKHGSIVKLKSPATISDK